MEFHKISMNVMVEQTGIEPISPELQSGALTNFATIPGLSVYQESNLILENHNLSCDSLY